VRTRRDQQSLSYPLRLPDSIQADALRLLDASREVINLTITALWGRLDEFATHTNRYAYKQVEEMIPPPHLACLSALWQSGHHARVS
jgi:putative transposase